MENEDAEKGHRRIVGNSPDTDFIIQEEAYPAGFKTSVQATGYALFHLILRGSYTEICGSDNRVRAAGTLVFHPPNLPRSESYSDDGAAIFCILINARRFSSLMRVLTETGPREFKNDLLVWLATRLYHEFQNPDAVSSLVIDGIVLEMLGRVLRSTARPAQPLPNWLIETRKILDDRFNEPLTLAELAEAVKVHPVYLATEFHRRYSSTVGDYVRQLRIQRAMRELTTSTTPLADIALNTGFSSQSHFSRTFKRLIGVSPGQYRVSSSRSCV